MSWGRLSHHQRVGTRKGEKWQEDEDGRCWSERQRGRTNFSTNVKFVPSGTFKLLDKNEMAGSEMAIEL